MRRGVVISIFLAGNALFWGGVYFVFLKAPETCFDAKQNQNEQGIDCGGICTNACVEVVVGEDFRLQEVAFVPGGDGRYDVLARITNGNDAIGASSFRYTFELRGAAGQQLGTRTGQGSISPRETKSIIEVNLETSAPPVAATFAVGDVTWERQSDYSRPAVGLYQQRYSPITTGTGYGEASGLTVNESPTDFRSVVVRVILRDGTGKPLAFNQTRQNNIRAGESRSFQLVWPLPFPGVVETVDMEADVDVYRPADPR